MENSSDEHRNHTARPWTLMAAPPMAKTQSSPGTLEDLLYWGESEDRSAAKPFLTGENGRYVYLNRFMPQPRHWHCREKKKNGLTAPPKNLESKFIVSVTTHGVASVLLLLVTFVFFPAIDQVKVSPHWCDLWTWVFLTPTHLCPTVCRLLVAWNPVAQSWLMRTLKRTPVSL